MKKCLAILLISIVVMLSLLIACAPKPAPPPAPPPEVVAYPVRPITLTVSWAAGGGTDIGARLLTPHVEKLLGQPITVVNIPGGGGWVGWNMLAQAKPDGYSIGYLNSPAIQTGYLNPELKNPFNLESFAPIINHVLDIGIVAVRADSPFKTMKELLDYAVANPGKLSWTTTGAFGDDHLRMLYLEQVVPGAKFKAVHTKGFAETITMVLGGHADILAANVGEVTPLEKEGKVRTLAVCDFERSKYLPHVPTLKELGYPLLNYSARGIAAPAGVPRPILEKLAKAFKEGMMAPEHVKKMDEQGLALKPILLDEYYKFLKDEEVLMKKLLGW